jgi:rhamnosyltransferase
MAPPKVSIVIPTKNGGALFLEVMQRLQSQVYEGFLEILVIDSGSTDKTVNYAIEHGATVKTIPPETFNHGLTRNYGISLSSGDIIILMTQDAVPADEHLVKNLVSAFSLTENVGGVYARQIPRPEADVITKRNLDNWLTGRTALEIREMKDEATYEWLSPMEKYMFCNFDNVCSAISRKAWEALPLGESNFGEDIEWCLHSLKAGWKIIYQPTAAVIHSHDRSVFYEHKRTYVCHGKLYELFGLCCVPSRKAALSSIILMTYQDLKYVLKYEKRLPKKLRLVAKTPLLSTASVLGQYWGAKDKRNQRDRKVSGV